MSRDSAVYAKFVYASALPSWERELLGIRSGWIQDGLMPGHRERGRKKCPRTCQCDCHEPLARECPHPFEACADFNRYMIEEDVDILEVLRG